MKRRLPKSVPANFVLYDMPLFCENIHVNLFEDMALSHASRCLFPGKSSNVTVPPALLISAANHSNGP